MLRVGGKTLEEYAETAFAVADKQLFGNLRSSRDLYTYIHTYIHTYLVDKQRFGNLRSSGLADGHCDTVYI